MKIFSTVNTKLSIPPNFKDLTADEPYILEMEKMRVYDVPDNIGEYYLRHRPQQFKKDAELPITLDRAITESISENTSEAEAFNPKKFIEDNLHTLDDTINLLNKDEINKIAEVLDIKIKKSDTLEKLKEKIINNIQDRLSGK